MFEITEETKNIAIHAIREVLQNDCVHDKHLTDEVIGEAFDKAVEVVKAQFGF